jgi:exodeoxyribonuclease VII large subunit
MTSTYLVTAFRDKDQVKALGARWDAARRQWYVPPGKDLTPFAAWLPAGSTVASELEGIGSSAAGNQTLPAVKVGASIGAPAETGQRGVSLSELLGGVSQVVSSAFREPVWVRVEVVDARLKQHVYLELAERSAQGDLLAKCHAMIWNAVAQRILPAFQQATGAELASGIKLLVRARPVFKAQYGFSLEIDEIDARYTLGDLEARKREIRERLQREGLFDRNRLLPRPWDHRHVLVIAPEGGAGLGDFQAEASRLQQQGVCQFLYVYSRFQGEGAASQIRQEMLAAWQNIAANHPWQPDALVLIRGGGAVNDLAWLNDYDLARAICELPVPVFTGIGHERDSTVLDEVAHTCFDTPSKVIAGIERTIVQRVREVQEHFGQIAHQALQHIQLARREVEHRSSQIDGGARSVIALARQQTERYQRDIGHLARAQVVMARRDVPAHIQEIRSEARQAMRLARGEMNHAWDTVVQASTDHLRRAQQDVQRPMQDIQAQALAHIRQGREQTQAMVREITGQGPQRTLERGFALIRDSQGKPVTRAERLDSLPLSSDSDLTSVYLEFADGRRVLQGRVAPNADH